MKKIFFALIGLLVTLSAVAQTASWTNTRQLRFFPIVTAADTAAIAANEGRVWFDAVTNKFRCNINGTNQNFGSGGGGGGGSNLYTINRQTVNYQPVLADGTNTVVQMDLAGANTFTVPDNATVAFPIGTLITVEQIGVGLTTIVQGGATIINTGGNLLSPGQRKPMTLLKTAINTWELWNGTPNVITGTLTNTRVTLSSGTNTVTDDPDLTFTQATNTLTSGRMVTVPTATLPGLNIGTFAGNPSTPVNGDTWLNTSTNAWSARVNGQTNLLLRAASIGSTARIIFTNGTSGGVDTDADLSFDGTNLTINGGQAFTTTSKYQYQVNMPNGLVGTTSVAGGNQHGAFVPLTPFPNNTVIEFEVIVTAILSTGAEVASAKCSGLYRVNNAGTLTFISQDAVTIIKESTVGIIASLVFDVLTGSPSVRATRGAAVGTYTWGAVGKFTISSL